MGVNNIIEGKGLVETLAILLNSIPPVRGVEITTDTENGQYLFTHRNHNIDVDIEGNRVTLDADSHVEWVIHRIDI